MLFLFIVYSLHYFHSEYKDVEENRVNPYRAGGRLNQIALFSYGYFSIKKGVWRSKIFLIHYELSENQKKLVFHSVLR